MKRSVKKMVWSGAGVFVGLVLSGVLPLCGLYLLMPFPLLIATMCGCVFGNGLANWQDGVE